MLNSTEIDKTNMKKHHLFIVIYKKHDEVIIFGSSPELQKLLPADKVLNIEMEIKKAMKNKNTPAAVIYLIFDKLHHLWKKHTVNMVKNKNSIKKSKNSNESTIKNGIYLLGSMGILSLFSYVLCFNKKKSKRD